MTSGIGAVLPEDDGNDEPDVVVDTPGDDSTAWRMEYANGAYCEVAVFQEADEDEDPSDLIQVEIGTFEDDPEPMRIRMHAHEATVLASYLGLAITQLIEWGSPLIPGDEE